MVISVSFICRVFAYLNLILSEVCIVFYVVTVVYSRHLVLAMAAFSSNLHFIDIFFSFSESQLTATSLIPSRKSFQFVTQNTHRSTCCV